MEVKSRGPKSRAGLTAYPALKPMEVPITRMAKPMVKASKPLGTGLLYGSTIARMQTSRAAVPIN